MKKYKKGNVCFVLFFLSHCELRIFLRRIPVTSAHKIEEVSWRRAASVCTLDERKLCDN